MDTAFAIVLCVAIAGVVTYAVFQSRETRRWNTERDAALTQALLSATALLRQAASETLAAKIAAGDEVGPTRSIFTANITSPERERARDLAEETTARPTMIPTGETEFAAPPLANIDETSLIGGPPPNRSELTYNSIEDLLRELPARAPEPLNE